MVCGTRRQEDVGCNVHQELLVLVELEGEERGVIVLNDGCNKSSKLCRSCLI